MAEPGNLLELAIDSLGKYIFTICLNLKSDREAKVIGSSIGNLITKTVPVTLADKMTNTLLQSLDYWTFHASFDRTQYTRSEEVIRNIIHPSVTKIQTEKNFNDSPEFYQMENFFSMCCVKAVIKNISSMTNLKVLDVHHYFYKCSADEVDFPAQLIEFSGLCSNALIDKLAKSCKSLKVLNVFESTDVTDGSITSILKMKNLEKLDISGTKISNEGVLRLFRDYIKKYGKSYNLRYLVTSALQLGEHFNMFAKNLPDLKILICKKGSSVQHYTNDVIENFNSINFQNVIGVDIKTTLSGLKEILQNMGNQLICLSVKIDDQDINPDDEVEISEILPFGQYCTCLKFLKLTWSICNCPIISDTMNIPLPGFQSVTNLVIEIEWEFKDDMCVALTDIVNFLLFQCMNVKNVMLPLDWCIFRKYDLIKTAVEMGYLQTVEIVYFQLYCNICCFTEVDDDGYDQDKDNEVVRMLIENCPNLRFIRGVPGLDENHPHNTQRIKFSSEYV